MIMKIKMKICNLLWQEFVAVQSNAMTKKKNDEFNVSRMKELLLYLVEQLSRSSK